MSLRFVSAGAAQGLVEAIARECGVEVAGSFGAVGAMLDKLQSGEAADVVILTRAQVDELAAQRRVLREGIFDLGAVATAVAVRISDPAPDISAESGLRATLLAADAIHFPDPSRATAGIHFMRVLDRLGIRPQLEERLRPHSNGMTAMRTLAAAAGHPLGCTQATEILATPGVRLVGPLPQGFELETIYTAAVHANAADPGAAAAFIGRLAADATRQRRTSAGFR